MMSTGGLWPDQVHLAGHLCLRDKSTPPLFEQFQIPLQSVGHCPSVRAVWHTRNDQDPALQWLRAQIADVAKQVDC